MKYVISYSYDLPHYADFIVEARNKKEALKKAGEALQTGLFSDVRGQPNDTAENERVSVCRRAHQEDNCLELI